MAQQPAPPRRSRRRRRCSGRPPRRHFTSAKLARVATNRSTSYTGRKQPPHAGPKHLNVNLRLPLIEPVDTSILVYCISAHDDMMILGVSVFLFLSSSKFNLFLCIVGGNQSSTKLASLQDNQLPLVVCSSGNLSAEVVLMSLAYNFNLFSSCFDLN